MPATDTIEIPIDKSKTRNLWLKNIVFLLIGAWLIIFDPQIRNPVMNNIYVKYAIGGACLLFFGLTFFHISKQLFGSKKIGFIVGPGGVTDNSSAIAAGFIPWSDITGLSSTKVFKQEFVIVHLKNPEVYVERQKNVLLRKTMQLNLSSYGSPVCISVNALRTNIGTLKQLLTERLQEYQQSRINNRNFVDR